jgi:hypothetical protein
MEGGLHMKTIGNRVMFGLATAVATLCIVLGGQAFVAGAGPNSSLVWTKLTLKNGWTGAPYGTRPPAVTISNGIVYFRGAMSTSGTKMHPFVLPPAYRPSTEVYVSVDLCDANYGRVWIQPTGAVKVEPENATLANAQCFTSLEGVSFAK